MSLSFLIPWCLGGSISFGLELAARHRLPIGAGRKGPPPRPFGPPDFDRCPRLATSAAVLYSRPREAVGRLEREEEAT